MIACTVPSERLELPKHSASRLQRGPVAAWVTWHGSSAEIRTPIRGFRGHCPPIERQTNDRRAGLKLDQSLSTLSEFWEPVPSQSVLVKLPPGGE